MANVQVGYGHSDSVGIPFDFYAGATLVTGQVIPMQSNILVVNPTGTLAVLNVTLPLNPVDGAEATISSTQILTSLVITANTGDVIVNGVLAAVSGMTPVSSVGAGSATATVRYKYTLNGFQAGNAAAVNPRTWIRIQ